MSWQEPIHTDCSESARLESVVRCSELPFCRLSLRKVSHPPRMAGLGNASVKKEGKIQGRLLAGYDQLVFRIEAGSRVAANNRLELKVRNAAVCMNVSFCQRRSEQKRDPKSWGEGMASLHPSQEHLFRRRCFARYCAFQAGQSRREACLILCRLIA